MVGLDAVMRLHIATDDPAEAHEFLRNAYSEHTAKLSGSLQQFRFSHRLAECGPFRVGIAQHTMRFEGDWDPMSEYVLFAHVLGGRLDISTPRAELHLGPGDVLSIDPDARTLIDWTGLRIAQIRMSRAAVARVAAELAGADEGAANVWFDLGRPRNQDAARHWKRLMHYVTADIATNAEIATSPLVVRQAFRLIVSSALETFPNTVDAGPGGPSAAPAAVRRALACIDERAGEDIDLIDIAEAAGVGPRALQRAFRRHLDDTPLNQLRRVRMQRAHDELRVANRDETTVAAVAARWGFGHPGRFAAEHRERFGTSPHETLTR